MGSTVDGMKKVFELSCSLFTTILEWVAEISWRRKWQFTPVFLPGKFSGQRSLADIVYRVVRVGYDLATKLPHTVVRCNY